MNRGDSAESGKKFGKKTAGGAAVVVFLAIYSVFQPWVNQKTGWNLPGLRQDSRGQIVADSKSASSPSRETSSTQTKTSTNESKADEKRSSETTKSTSKSSEQKASVTPKPGESETKRGPLASRMRPSKSAASKSPRGPPQAATDSGDLRYGLLREVGPDRYMSPAGLLYGPGSAEGHRLEHLRRHVKDMPGRPVHGVFDGDMEGALETIDQAYEKAKKGVRTTKKEDDGRTIYTVDMGKRIGYSGGRAGAQKRNPMARRVRLVLEGTQVITAYPVN